MTLERLKNWFPRGAYITGLVGISLGLLAHFLAIIVLLQFFAPFAHETMGGWAILYALLAGIATLLVLLGLWYWGRFRIGHFRPIVRWMLAVLLFPVAIGGIVLALMMG